jgi:hypothetical protein
MASALVIAVLLFSVCLSGAAVAQKDSPLVTISPQSTGLKTAVADATISNGHAPPGYIDILPPGKSGTGAGTGRFGVLAIYPRETLTYTSGVSSDYAATYIGACGAYSRTPSLLASSVYAQLSSKTLANLQVGEILVMHQWGQVVNDVQPENDIVVGRNWTKPANVDFTIYVSAFGNPWVKTISLPATHSFSIYIKTVNPIGTSYSRLEFSVYDATTMKYYTYQYALPAAQRMDSADIALEKYYAPGEQRPGLVYQWRTVTGFHVYDQYKRCVDLSQSGFVCEWLTSGVATAYYHDYKYYVGTRNGDGTFSMTRYPAGSQYPSHP